jgi:hypothetical protein
MKSEPYQPEAMRFDSHAGGRVAYVTRRDGRRAIDATAEDGRRVSTDLWLTRVAGQWRIFA